ncbi:MAG: fructose-6-phosphate aldolase [Rickettsiaceae bacterium]
MKIFLDSVNLDDIKKYQDWGVIDGVTTNPSLITNSTMSFTKTVELISSLVIGDVSIEVAATDYEGMIREGDKILSIAKNIVVKLPTTWAGLRACKYFAVKDKKVNMTLCFSANQALLAAKAGAYYISPFIGRLDDVGADGMQLIADIRDIYDNYEYRTQILAASIRTPDHCMQSALCGADIATMSEKTLAQLVQHPLTDQGLIKFQQDWSKSGMTI